MKNELFPFCHARLSWKRRAALWLLDRLEMLWDWAHTNAGEGAVGFLLGCLLCAALWLWLA